MLRSDDVTLTTMPSLGFEASALVVQLAPGKTRKPDGKLRPGQREPEARQLPRRRLLRRRQAPEPMEVGWIRTDATDLLGPITLAPNPITTWSPIMTCWTAVLMIRICLICRVVEHIRDVRNLDQAPPRASSLAYGPTKL